MTETTETTDGWVRVCALDDVPTDEALGVLAGGLELALARHGDEVLAVRDVCSHAQVALSEGDVAVDDSGEGSCRIECWLHGSMFDMRSGKPTGPPAIDPVAVFGVEVRDGDVYVDPTTTLNGVDPD